MKTTWFTKITKTGIQFYNNKKNYIDEKTNTKDKNNKITKIYIKKENIKSKTNSKYIDIFSPDIYCTWNYLKIYNFFKEVFLCLWAKSVSVSEHNIVHLNDQKALIWIWWHNAAAHPPYSRCQGPDSLSEASGDKCAALSVENRSSSSPSCYFDYLSHWETITARFSVIWLILVVRNTWWLQRNRPRWAHLLLGTGRPEEEDPDMSPAATQQHSDECQPLEEESGRSCIHKEIFSDSAFLSCFPVHV